MAVFLRFLLIAVFLAIPGLGQTSGLALAKLHVFSEIDLSSRLEGKKEAGIDAGQLVLIGRQADHGLDAGIGKVAVQDFFQAAHDHVAGFADHLVLARAYKDRSQEHRHGIAVEDHSQPLFFFEQVLLKKD